MVHINLDLFNTKLHQAFSGRMTIHMKREKDEINLPLYYQREFSEQCLYALLQNKIDNKFTDYMSFEK